LVICAISDTGLVREKNEDSYIIFECGGTFAVVADGMGGHNAGEVASFVAVQKIREYIESNIEKDDIKNVLREAFETANEAVFEQAHTSHKYFSMGTTAVLAYIKDDRLYVVNVGDSRAYLITENRISQITRDHSVVAELVRRGEITKIEAENHPQKNMITKAIGTDFKVKPDIFEYEIEYNDIVILCSDGLYSMVSDEEILHIMLTERALQSRLEELKSLANERGGFDNITIIAAKAGS